MTSGVRSFRYAIQGTPGKTTGTRSFKYSILAAPAPPGAASLRRVVRAKLNGATVYRTLRRL